MNGRILHCVVCSSVFSGGVCGGCMCPPASSQMGWGTQDVLKHSYIMLNCG